jgi:hypothetical protein
MSATLPDNQLDRVPSAIASLAAFNSLRLCGLICVSLLVALLAGATRSLFWDVMNQIALEDIWLAAAGLLLAGLSALASRMKLDVLALGRTTLALSAVAVVVLCYIGHYAVLHGYDLTRDEQMVRFMPAVSQPTAWVSTYLPGNAALHALVGRFTDDALTAPLLAGMSLPLLWSCARKIWPEDREAATVAIVLLVCSGQFLLSGMTAYAMPAHLFFNLVWLRLFLNDRRFSDVIALAVGWFATGLHQPLFHPLFVAPLLLVLLIERRWRRLAFLGVGYLAIGVFWLQYPEYQHGLVSGPLSTDLLGAGFIDRIRAVFNLDWTSLWLTCANLFRFITWQHILLIPLMLAAWPAIRRDRLAASLALGLVLPIVVIAIILPFQGPGFGYRYLHPVLGNAALLGTFGWRALAPIHDRLRPAMLAASAAGLAILLPVQMGMSYLRYAPNARASATIDASGADYAVIRVADGFHYTNVVLNHPDLANRPIRLWAEKIKDPARLAARICKPGTKVAFATNSFYLPGAAYFGIKPDNTADAYLPTLRAPYEAAGCQVVLLR